MKKRLLSLILILGMLAGMFTGTVTAEAVGNADDLLLWYDFSAGEGETVVDKSGNDHDGTLNGTCKWTTAPNGSGAVELDGNSGYVQMPDKILAGLTDITVAANVSVDPSNADPAWIFTFGSAEDAKDENAKYLGMLEDRDKNFRCSITTNHWTEEQTVNKGSSLEKDAWKSVVYTLSGDTGTLYVDGVKVAQNTEVTTDPNDIEDTIANFIGKPSYAADNFFKGKVSDFRIYSSALDASAVETLWINSLSDADAVSAVKDRLSLGDTTAIMSDMTLPTEYAGVSVSWSSGNTDVITDAGAVTRPEAEDVKVTLTATIARGEQKTEKTFSVTVLKSGTIYSLDSNKYTLYLNGTHETVLTATDETSKDITADASFSSSDEKVATVDESGVVTGVGIGTAIITVTYGGQEYPVDVTVANDMVLWYKLNETSGTTAADSSGNKNDGTLNGGTWLDGNGIELDGKDDYIQMPDGVLSELKDVTVSTKVYVDASSTYPSWIFAFGTTDDSNSHSDAHYFGLLLASDCYRAMLATKQWHDEQSTKASPAFSKGVWKCVTYTQSGTTGTLYVDGAQVAKNTGVTYTPDNIEHTVANFIGKPPYIADHYFMGKISDFRLYNRALSESEVAAISENGAADDVALDKAALDLGVVGAVTSKITLPSEGKNGSTITWASSDESVVSPKTGIVTRPQYSEGDKTVTLTATIKKSTASDTKEFSVIVKAMDEGKDQAVEEVKPLLSIPDADDVRGNITLPATLESDVGTVTITWSTDHPDIVNVNETKNDNYDSTPAGVVTRPETDTQVKLTATLAHSGVTGTKEITITVKAKPKAVSESDYTGYLFAYFNGTARSDAEQIYFASSKDGLHYDELNEGDPVLTSSVGDKGVRDPFIMRSAEGDKFYLLATDLRIANGAGWGAAQEAGSQSLVVWESDDLVNWSNERLVKVALDTAGCTWAPEATYDEKTGEYLVYWASKVLGKDGFSYQKIYVSKTRDFYTFTTPTVWIDRGVSVIDATVIQYGGVYYRFSKDETNKNILIDTSSQLLDSDSISFSSFPSKSVGSQSGVEGPTCYKLNGENKWVLLLDHYHSEDGGGYYPMVSTNLASGEFTVLDSSEYSLPTGPRHGTVMSVTQEEYDAIRAKWGDEVTKPVEDEQKDPILAYQFEEKNPDGTIRDSSGNNHTGTLNGSERKLSRELRNI